MSSFGEVTEGLATTQKEKLATLVENVEFESEADYREKLVTLKESYFPSNAGSFKETSRKIYLKKQVLQQTFRIYPVQWKDIFRQ